MTPKQSFDHHQHFDTWTDEQQVAHILYEHGEHAVGGSAEFLAWPRADRFKVHQDDHWTREPFHDPDPEPRELDLVDKYPFGFVSINDVRVGLKKDGALMEPITVKQGDVLSMAWPVAPRKNVQNMSISFDGTLVRVFEHSGESYAEGMATVPPVPILRCKATTVVSHDDFPARCEKPLGHKKKHKFQIKWED